MNQPEVVIYGASGYTGKLIAWHLAEKGIAFIAAGRNQQRLEQQMAQVPELANASYQCVAVEHNEDALTQLFSGKKVVYNVVGPFMQLGDPVVRACLSAGCSYLDTTGEVDWMTHLKNEYGPSFAEKNLLLCPATSWMWLGGQIAAELALEEPGVDSLDICYLADSNTSVASTMSFLRMLTKDQHYLENNELHLWPQATSYSVSIPGMHRQLNALPWSGGAEPLWYQDDGRVANCSVLVAFRNQEMLNGIVSILEDFEANHKSRTIEEQEKITNDLGGQLVSEEPERETPQGNRSILSCYGRGATASTTVVLRGHSPYVQTGAFAAEAVQQILLGQQQGAGFISPCQAFGARKMLAAIASKGYLSWEIKEG